MLSRVRVALIAVSLLIIAALVVTLTTSPGTTATANTTSQRPPAHTSAASLPVFPQAFVARNVAVPMRDGKLLAADVYLPGANGQVAHGQFPTLVQRTPYGKNGYQSDALFFARHGYAVVLQDVRGSGASQGVFYPYVNDAKDSYDTIEWAAHQPWSTGKVGTFGVSYDAATQMLMVHDHALPPNLVAIAPGYASSSYYGDGAYAGGAFRMSHNLDYETTFGLQQYDRTHGTAGQITPIKKAEEALDQLYWHMPLKPFKPLLQAGDPTYEDYMTHYLYDRYWAQLNDQPFYDKLNLPVLSYSGWYDLFDQGTVLNYQGVRNQTSATSEREAQLIMGPYEHANQASTAQGMMAGEPYNFPANSTYVDDELDLAFFDQYMRGANVFSGVKPVRLYVPGAGFDSWIGSTNFPLPESQATNYYLHSNGTASIGHVDVNHLGYEGTLTTAPPSASEPTDKYTYNPNHPVITIEGYDQHWAGGVNEETEQYLDHKDILVYQTRPLAHDTALVGPITLTLYASTSAPTTDFMANLSDVDPSDHTLFVAEGARRGGVGNVSGDPRNPVTYSKAIPLVPGKVYEYKIAIWPTGRVFAKGHSIRIDITSSDFPHFNRNPNTSPKLTADTIARAHQTIYHNSRYPSHVTLPIVPMAAMQQMKISGVTPPGYPQNGDQVYQAAQAAPPAPADQTPISGSTPPNWVPVGG